MENIYILFDDLYSGYFIIILNSMSLISIIFAVMVITTKNPITSVLYLIGLFFSVACYLISIGLVFIGISYLLVYVGAVSILFLFILMLINIRVSELVTETKNSLPLVFIITLIFENAYSIIFSQNNYLHDTFINSNYTSNSITYYGWENNLSEFTHINNIGNIIYTNYNIWLILASIILLLSMVGAIVITVKQRISLNEEKDI